MGSDESEANGLAGRDNVGGVWREGGTVSNEQCRRNQRAARALYVLVLCIHKRWAIRREGGGGAVECR